MTQEQTYIENCITAHNALPDYERQFAETLAYVIMNKNYQSLLETMTKISKLFSDAYATVMTVDAKKCREFAIQLENASNQKIIKPSKSVTFDILHNENVINQFVPINGWFVIDESITDIEQLHEEVEGLGFDWDICVLYLYGGVDALHQYEVLKLQYSIRKRLAIQDCYPQLNTTSQSLRDMAKELRRMRNEAYYSQKQIWDDNKERYAVIHQGKVVKTDINRFPKDLREQIDLCKDRMESFDELRSHLLELYHELWNFMKCIDPDN